ncbi:hypothetical protein FKG94_03150 [Exilibacterium tricleocarpae]|uniref:Uncharacterized protein n=1 Tax=Exilibacterium tricleocarpae TaxID=2591008 RepID=A0A545U6U6_9GAMM|nr:hypothetical protein [Exilibacterium tricleocarpae]TQV85201.1 hypothetical protein FKG94_03150 [Exilibacterium tricleocarpae]
MAWTQKDLDDLEKAFKSGVLKVKYQDRETEYRSFEEMKALLEEARAQLSGKVRTPHTFTSYDRGYQ